MVATKIWDAQMGAQLKDTSGRGYAWDAGQNVYYSGSRCRSLAASRLIEGINAEYLLADKGYDSEAQVEFFQQAKESPVIPPRRSRNSLRSYDKYLYRLRHLVGNAFLELKHRRGIATRYAKNTTSFLDAVHIRCIPILAKIK